MSALLTGLIATVLGVLTVCSATEHLKTTRGSAGLDDPNVMDRRSQSCDMVTLQQLPFLEACATIEVVTPEWLYESIPSFFEVNQFCLVCGVCKEQMLCSDGVTMLVGLYSHDDNVALVSYATRLCLDSTTTIESIRSESWEKDMLKQDLETEGVLSSEYLRQILRINCTIHSNEVVDIDEVGPIQREVPYTGGVENLPFRASGPREKVDPLALRWANKGTVEYYALDAVNCECYVVASQIICTDWTWIKFGEFIEKLDAYTISGKSRYCIDGNLTFAPDWYYEGKGDLIEDDAYAYGALTTEDILVNTGLSCHSTMMRGTRLATSGAKCPRGIKLYKMAYGYWRRYVQK